MAYDAREMCDMILLYGETHGNAAEALRLYRERYPNRRHPHNPRFLLGAVQRVRENRRIVPGNPERAMNGIVSVALEERVLEHFRECPTSSTRILGFNSFEFVYNELRMNRYDDQVRHQMGLLWSLLNKS